MLDLVTIPSASTAISGISSYSDGYAQAFMPWAYFIVGVLLGGMFVSFVARVLINGVSHFLSERKQGNTAPFSAYLISEAREDTYLISN